MNSLLLIKPSIFIVQLFAVGYSPTLEIHKDRSALFIDLDTCTASSVQTGISSTAGHFYRNISWMCSKKRSACFHCSVDAWYADGWSLDVDAADRHFNSHAERARWTVLVSITFEHADMRSADGPLRNFGHCCCY